MRVKQQDDEHQQVRPQAGFTGLWPVQGLMFCCCHLEILDKYDFVYLVQWGNDNEQKEGNLWNMQVVNHFPPHLHIALTMLCEHAISEQRVSVKTGVHYHRVIHEHRDVHEHSKHLSRNKDFYHILTVVPPCISWPLKQKRWHRRKGKDGATQSFWSFQSFFSHQQVKKRVRWYMCILISKIKPGGFVTFFSTLLVRTTCICLFQFWYTNCIILVIQHPC